MAKGKPAHACGRCICPCKKAMKARQRPRGGVCRFPVWPWAKPAHGPGAPQGGAFVIVKNSENAAPACAGFRPPTNHPLYNTMTRICEAPESRRLRRVHRGGVFGGRGGNQRKKPTGPPRRGPVMGFSIGSPKNMPAQILTVIRNLTHWPAQAWTRHGIFSWVSEEHASPNFDGH